MIFVNVEEPTTTQFDVGDAKGVTIQAGSGVTLDGSPYVWTVLAHVRDVVLIRQEPVPF